MPIGYSAQNAYQLILMKCGKIRNVFLRKTTATSPTSSRRHSKINLKIPHKPTFGPKPIKNLLHKYPIGSDVGVRGD